MTDPKPVCETLTPSGNPGDGLDLVPVESRAAYKAGYEAGLASGREAGYRQGYREGFSDRSHQGKGGAAEPAKSEEYTGRRLLGLPCASCGCCFYSDETRCPRCKSPRTQPSYEDLTVPET